MVYEGTRLQGSGVMGFGCVESSVGILSLILFDYMKILDYLELFRGQRVR